MRIYMYILLLLLTSQYGIGQQYIRLSDGCIVADNHDMISPIRTIENVKDGILVTYEFNYVSIDTDELFPSTSVLSFDGFGIEEKSEKPGLPIRWDTFYVPSKKDYTINILDSSYIELPFEIAPARPPMENSSFSEYTTDNVLPIKPYKDFYPKNTINTTLNIYREYPLLGVCISPIRYNYEQKRVRVCKKISYLININQEKNRKYLFNDTIANIDPLLKNIVMNPKEQNKDKEVLPKQSMTQIDTPKYLILTVPQFYEAANKFADWKRTLGYNVEIISQVVWDENTVKNAVVNSDSLEKISYLLIFGDYEDIPGKHVTRKIYTTTGIRTYNFFTDYYYGCIHQNTYPDIRRGRISASSQTEANIIIDKIINYEKNPIIDSCFYKTSLHCAYFQDELNDSIEDYRYTLTVEEICNHMIQQGKTIKRIYYTPFSVTPKYWRRAGNYGTRKKTQIPNELLRSSGFLWNGNRQDIINGINNGAFYVLHRDHGGWREWGQPSFSSNDIEQLNNENKLPVIFSMNCLTGTYNKGVCLAEAFLRKSKGGGVGVFAATEVSFSGYNDALTLAMFEAIWPTPSFVKPFRSDTTISLTSTPIYKLGDLLDLGLARIHTIYPGGGEETILHTKEIFHCFGDPAMDMHTDLPTPFTNVSITKKDGNLIVSTGENATITFYNRATGSIVSYHGNSITYPNDNNIQICISAHNKIPYIKEAGCHYIQNENISNTTTYHADQIKVGSNVTPLKSPGPVVVSNGKTTLIGDIVELNGETTIQLGAEFEIKN